ncbi:polyketide cyclase [Micractinium conductrix]|uniref:Polyketide cyclase n=1 Tax=Micractinium conductrix TaxID=554055 RepID=A0A2P6V3E7_9CHLO|nr:polyketide cyclase [Micractinium conductrix]|eukprot:PSC68605.1 polyketide cyclase [Micractinium conductrix]
MAALQRLTARAPAGLGPTAAAAAAPGGARPQQQQPLQRRRQRQQPGVALPVAQAARQRSHMLPRAQAAGRLLPWLFPKQQEEEAVVRTAGGAAPAAADTVRAYYDRYNARDIDGVLDLMAEDVYYHDMIYEDAFCGLPELTAYFKKVEALIPDDVRFVVEDLTEGDPRRCGVRWHVELTDDRGQSVEFPFSRGVSFYEVNDQGKIIYARDCVEPALKPGSSALGGIGVIAPLVRKLGPNANPAVLKTLPIASGLMWAFYAGYFLLVMLSTAAPGLPAWQTPPETLQTVLNESYNYFYINIGLAQLGLNPVPCIAEHPVSEALFNFVNAWSLMFWPVMVADPLGRRVPNKFPIWVGTQFLTNVFLPIYLALRLRPDPPAASADDASSGSGSAAAPAQAPPTALPSYAPIFGGVALAVGAVSVWWALEARPEAGDLAARWAYFSGLLASSRVDWAFGVDASLYAVWQAWLLGAAGAAPLYRFVPFFGMAAWLLRGSEQPDEPAA